MLQQVAGFLHASLDKQLRGRYSHERLQLSVQRTAADGSVGSHILKVSILVAYVLFDIHAHTLHKPAVIVFQFQLPHAVVLLASGCSIVLARLFHQPHILPQQFTALAAQLAYI